MARQLFYESILLGCDPELFLVKNGKVVGAEKVIPKEGLRSTFNNASVVIDGVQVELHPNPSQCRQSLSLFLMSSLEALQRRINEVDPEIRVSFDPHVEVSETELDSLSPECKLLGCSPSLNIYGFSDLGVDPATYRRRSAGGHIHIGFTSGKDSPLWNCRERVVAVLDVLLGSFCVMLDRDPYAAERRKVYGRAGEYRLPPHGLEYRTLSNFWLRSYPLFSLVMAQARQAVGVSYTSRHAEMGTLYDNAPYTDLESELFARVDPQMARAAINENNLDLAKQVWVGVKDFYRLLNAQASGLSAEHLPAVDRFLAQIEDKGLGYWFPDDPLRHWFSNRYAQYAGDDIKTLGYKHNQSYDGWEQWLHKAVSR